MGGLIWVLLHGIKILLKKQMIPVPQKSDNSAAIGRSEVLAQGALWRKAGGWIIFSLLRRVLKFYIINSGKISGNNYEKRKV
ncbi:MAG: hypothetical protein MZV64_27305 [Ignavibacteriales bacterium]|nr:hypothetical protein [Ignavibacteriales bacterium]